jgi:hypothetical protein
MTNAERALRGAQTIDAYREGDGALTRSEAATDAITDILHAYCDGDELAAEDILRVAKAHFVEESDAEAT